MTTTATHDAAACRSKVMPPINIHKWVEENRDRLKPPVGNQYLYDGDGFFVMVIGGPNARNDFHMSQSEEYFFQLKGDIVVRIIENGKIKDVPIREGETFFIPRGVPHSPTRPPGTVGGPFFAVHLDIDELVVHHLSDLLVFERFMFHHMAPVAGGVTNAQEDRFVLFPGGR